MLIDRILTEKVRNDLKPKKVIAVLGSRRTGKTEILKKIHAESTGTAVFLNGDDIETHNLLEYRSSENYKRLFGSVNLLIIDEAQEIPEIGKKLKLIVDTLDTLCLLISGSSALNLTIRSANPWWAGCLFTGYTPLLSWNLAALRIHWKHVPG